MKEKEKELKAMFCSSGWKAFEVYWLGEIENMRNDLERLDEIKTINKTQGRIDAIRTMLNCESIIYLICQPD